MWHMESPRIFNQCLNKICLQFRNDHTEEKQHFCQQIYEFLVNTPQVFEHGWSPNIEWTKHLFRGLSDMVQSRSNRDMRIPAIKLASILIQEFGGFQWATEEDKPSSSFFGILTRLACVELSLAIDSEVALKDSLVGSCLVIIEHSILTLVEESQMDLMEPKMKPEETCSLITFIREAVMKVVEYLIELQSLDMIQFASLEKEVEANILGFIRLTCLFMNEETILPNEKVEQLVPIFSNCISRHEKITHIVLTALIVYLEKDDEGSIKNQVKIHESNFKKSTDSCKLCESQDSICETFKRFIKI